MKGAVVNLYDTPTVTFKQFEHAQSVIKVSSLSKSTVGCSDGKKKYTRPGDHPPKPLGV